MLLPHASPLTIMDDIRDRYAVFGGPVSGGFVPSDKPLVIRTDNYSTMRHSAYMSDMYECIWVRLCRLPLMPCLFPSIRIEELSN